jgi:hypothetical protein
MSVSIRKQNDLLNDPIGKVKENPAMMKRNATRSLAAGLLLLLFIPATSLADKASQEKLRRADVASPDAVVRAVYESISGPAGRDRDWERMRNLWLGSARIIFSSSTYDGKIRWENMALEAFIVRVSEYYKSEGFYEREIASTIHRFGNVAQIWSTFEVRRGSLSGPVIDRGINSWQLVMRDGRWWITQLIYDFETPKNPIPERYLAK